MLARLLSQFFIRAAPPPRDGPSDAHASVERLCRSVLRSEPDPAAAHGLLGASLVQQANRAADAISSLERAIALAPENAEFHGNCGEACRRCGRLRRAVGCFETALRIQPGNAGAWHNLALAEQWLANMEAALGRAQCRCAHGKGAPKRQFRRPGQIVAHRLCRRNIYRLFRRAHPGAARPAPLQLSYLGYLNTTGMDAIDYRITDGRDDPPGVADDYYAERLLRLPHSMWCFQPGTTLPEPGPLPALARGRITFGSFNYLAKVSEEVRVLWARLLLSVRGSRLLMVGVPE